MSDGRAPDLTFPKITFGPCETPWDLRVYLYRGGASMRSFHALNAIDRGTLKAFCVDRLPLITALHAALAAKVASGARKGSIKTALCTVKRFYSWADANSQPLTIEKAKQSFVAWIEELIFRYRIKKDLAHKTAYHSASILADLLAHALQEDSQPVRSGKSLLALTRMSKPKQRPSIGSALGDKQNLAQTFAFGSFLADICSGLDVATIRGQAPVTLALRDGRNLIFKCELKAPGRALQNFPEFRRADAARAREPLRPDESTTTLRRRAMLRLRIEAELLIFVTQTGMNLAQAHLLRREDYRWRTEGEDVEVFRVYKSRRRGESLFRAYKEYKQHLQDYLAWLEQTGLALLNDRLFPQLSRGPRVAAEDALPGFRAMRKACAEVGLRYIGPRELRKTRVNWLLRHSRDPDMTAALNAHAKETLFRHYERPHHQSAISEITAFHQSHDPAFKASGPGICVQNAREPIAVLGSPRDAPTPDCANPDGCFFCVYHRDEMSLDYCWRLASARHLKVLEVALWRSPASQPVHPANLVIDRINAKFQAICLVGLVQAEWVDEATARIREGTFHPSYSALIELAEMLM